MNKVSLCIPTYNRPETLRQLINSYLKQEYSNKELVVSDDTRNDSIRNLIEEFNEDSIKYFHNDPGIGFYGNLLKAMERASGKYIIILGDDDVLLNTHVFSDYAKIFDTKPAVGFIYSSQVQFSDRMKVEYVINFAHSDKQYKKGREAIENIWIRSIFIGGIGIRNEKNLRSLYPTKKILHPQVEFIGNILNHSDGYIIAKNHIGFRSHDDQIIFRALKNKKIRQEGNHMTVELFDIFNNLNEMYKLHMNFDFVARQLIDQQLVMIFKEKSILGNKEMENNYKRFCTISKRAKDSKKLKVAFVLAKILPAFAIKLIRNWALQLVAFKNRKAHAEFKNQLMTITQ